MKTAAFWIGKKWSIQTKKLGETEAHEVIVDVERITSGNDLSLSYRSIPNQDPEKHYTLVVARGGAYVGGLRQPTHAGCRWFSLQEGHSL